MIINVGDIVCVGPVTNSTDLGYVTMYKVLKVNNNNKPVRIQEVSRATFAPRGIVINDDDNSWRNIKWHFIKKSTPVKPLTEADKKYEKIILKIRDLDAKFKQKKELKNENTITQFHDAETHWTGAATYSTSA